MKPTPMVVVCAAVLLFWNLSSVAQDKATTSPRTDLPPAPAVTGSGTKSYLPVWTGSSTVGNSHLFESGGNTGVNTTTPKWAFDVNGRVNVSVAYLIGDNTVLSLAGPASDANIAVGYEAFPSNSSVTLSTAVGAYAMKSMVSGVFETAVGAFAMYEGDGTEDDAALGAYALYANQNGQGNTALGAFALRRDVNGSNNIGIGYTAGIDIAGSNNIDIANTGTSTDNGIVRIGTAGNQTSVFVAGVNGTTTGDNDAVPVVIDSNGQLGTVSSSRRFKEDIQNMGDASLGLMRLRPVTFRYQKAFSNGSKPMQYGLIAEEVAEVYPDLVAHSADGQIETVKYQVLDSMLLNEVQRQQSEIKELQEQLDRMKAALAELARTSKAK